MAKEKTKTDLKDSSLDKKGSDQSNAQQVDTNVIVSTKSRGIIKFGNSGVEGLSPLEQLIDVFVAPISIIWLQTVYTWVSVLLCVVFFLIFYFTKVGGKPADYIYFSALIPVVLQAFWVLKRREEAANATSKLKYMSFHLFNSVSGDQQEQGQDSVKSLKQAIISTLNSVNGYITHKRSFTYTNTLQQIISQHMMPQIQESLGEMTQLIMEVHYKLANLQSVAKTTIRQSKLNAQEAAQALGLVDEIVKTFSQINIIKEYRIPQALRVFTRISILIATPMVLAQYQAAYFLKEQALVSFVFLLMSQVAVSTLLSLVVLLEDPYANTLDGVSLLEHIDQLSTYFKFSSSVLDQHQNPLFTSGSLLNEPSSEPIPTSVKEQTMQHETGELV